jgi:hypothetical protein
MSSEQPEPGEIWEEADGCLLLRMPARGGHPPYWVAFGASHVHDDSPGIAHPLRRRFDIHGQDVVADEPLRYPDGLAYRVVPT